MAGDHRFCHYLSTQPQGDLADGYTAWRRDRTAQHQQNIHRHADERLKVGIQRLGLAGHVAHRIVAHPSLGWRLVLADEP
jgi:hypothetical protein